MNLSIITKALAKQLDEDPDVAAFMGGRAVVRDEPVNESPNVPPWIGVYKGKVTFEPRTLGYNSDEAMPSPRVVVQAASMKSGEDCGDKLESYVNTVIAAIRSDKTIGGTVDVVTSLAVEYGYVETDRTTMHLQTAILTINRTVDDYE